jgi:hypothetical protein
MACQRDWSEFMKNAEEEGTTRERKKMVLVMRIRENLEKYRQAYLKRIWNERKILMCVSRQGNGCLSTSSE